MQPVMTVAEVEAFLRAEFPQVYLDGPLYRVEKIAPGLAALRFTASGRHLRPGGTVSGPAMMALADLAAYVVILGHIGPVALAVTTNLTINFLRKPAPGDLIATCRILKLGQRLAVVDCAICGDGEGEMAAHATATYSIPPRRQG